MILEFGIRNLQSDSFASSEIPERLAVCKRERLPEIVRQRHVTHPIDQAALPRGPLAHQADSTGVADLSRKADIRLRMAGKHST